MQITCWLLILLCLTSLSSLKAPCSSKIDICFIQERFNKLINSIKGCKISVSLSFLNWIKNEMIFYRISELMLATLIQRYTERKKKRRVNFIPKFHLSLKKFVKYFTMITKRYMYGTKVPNFIGLWSTSLELLKFISSYPANLEIKIKLKINIGCAPLLLLLLP